MFHRACPNCQKNIPFHYRKQLLRDSAFDCPYCRKRLTIRSRDSVINAALCGVFIGILCNFFHVSLWLSMVLASLSAFCLQKYLDVFFSLQIDKDC